MQTCAAREELTGGVGEWVACRYGFNGKELDSDGEWGQGTTAYDYGFRIYNPAIARFLSVDPLTSSYPMLTPYQFASNRPIDGIDLDGLEFMSSNQSMFRFTRGGQYLDLTNASVITQRALGQLPGVVSNRNGQEVLELQGSYIADNGQMLSMAPPKNFMNVHFKRFPKPNVVHEFDVVKRAKGRPNSSKRATYRKNGSVKSRTFTGVKPLPIGPNLPLTALVLATEALQSYEDYKEEDLKQTVVSDLTTAYNQSAQYGDKISSFLANQVSLGDDGLIPSYLRNEEDVVRLANYMLDGSIDNSEALDQTLKENISEVGQILYYELLRSEIQAEDK